MRRPQPFNVAHIRVRAIRGPRGNAWYWRAEVHRDGSSRTVWTGWGNQDEVARTVAAIVASGEDTPTGPMRLDDIRTVHDLLEVWCAAQIERQELAPRSLAQYLSSAKRLHKTRLKFVPIQRLNRRTLEQWRTEALNLYASGTVAQDLVTLQMAWAWAQALGVISRDLPDCRIRVRRTRNGRTPTPGDVAAMLAHLDGWAARFVRLAYATGVRIGEAGALQWDDLEGNWLTIDGKTGPRRVPVGDHVLEMLGEPGRGSLLGVAPTTLRSHVGRMMSEACEAAGVPVFTPHGLRRLCADQMARAGIPIDVIARYLGNSPAVLWRHYRQVQPADLEDAMRRAGLGWLPAGEVVTLHSPSAHKAKE